MEKLLPFLPLWYKKMVLEHDYEAENRLYQMGRYRDVWFVSCQKLLEKEEFTGLMQKIFFDIKNSSMGPSGKRKEATFNDTGTNRNFFPGTGSSGHFRRYFQLFSSM